MRYLVIFLVLLLLSCLWAIQNKANGAGYADAEAVCLYVAENDKKRLRKMLKDLHINVRQLYPDVTCNGNNLVQFAMVRKADDVGVFLIGQIPVSKLAEQGDLEWANANGHGGTEITKALEERIGG